jgi:hypothetical protein
LLASHVLDETEEERITIRHVSHERGERCDSRRAGRTPPALAGDELEAALGAPADDDRLQDAL